MFARLLHNMRLNLRAPFIALTLCVALVFGTISLDAAFGFRGQSEGTDTDADIAISHNEADSDVGDISIVYVSCRNSTAVTVTGVTDDDGDSNTWTQITGMAQTSTVDAQALFVDAWYKIVGASGGTTHVITVALSGSCNSTAQVGSFSGPPASLLFCPSAKGENSDTTHSAGSLTGINGDLFVSATVLNSGFTVSSAPTSFSQMALGSRLNTYYHIATGDITTTAEWTSGTVESTLSMQMIVRDSAVECGGGGPAATPQRGLLVGVN